MQRTIEVSETPLWIGNEIYIVESKDSKNFFTKCPSCDDTRKIRYIGANGEEFETKCPYCDSHQGSSTYLKLRDWIVSRYIVNSVQLMSSEAMSSYKKGVVPKCDVSEMSAFSRCGRGYDDINTRRIPVHMSGLLDPTCPDYTLSVGSHHLSHPEDYIFHKKKDAEDYCRKLRKNEKQELLRFNEKWGTSYGYPFEN